MTISHIAAALQNRVEAFQALCASNDHWPAVPELRGAALLVQDVAELAHDQVLKETARSVITMLDALERSAEDEDLAGRQAEWEEGEAKRKVRRENYRLVQTVIGMDLIDPRWAHLVSCYQKAFPAFKVAASVKTRISPKALSSVLRKEVVELLHKRHRDQRIGRGDIDAVRGEAMSEMERQTLRYLSKALPGYDFEAELPGRE